ncbi:MAG TPA: amino acid permease [Candidatus Bathyarchaeota archaeon]|nr:amino acid permease [Candidatus Bathyarchaeota archaeon]
MGRCLRLERAERTLARRLGFWETLGIGVGSTIGGSIFVILGDTARLAGPAAFISFFLGALITLLIALNYSELATSLPVSGGGYVFTREAIGGLSSFLTGWFLWVGNMLYAAMNAVGFALIAARYLPLNPILIAEVVLWAFCILNVIGVKETGRTQLILTTTLLAGLLFLTISSIAGFDRSNLEPLMPMGMGGVLAAAGLSFVAYWGFETIAAVGGEVRKPERTIPLCCVLSVLVCSAIYVSVTLASIGLVGWEALAESETPLILVGSALLGDLGETLVSILGAIATLTSLNSALLSAARIAYALAKTELLPRGLAIIHGRFRTPYGAVMLSSALAALFTLTGFVSFLAEAASFGFLTGLLLVNVSLMVLRRKRRYLPRKFKTPLYPLTPVLAIVACLALIPFMDPAVLAVSLAIGLMGSMVFLFELATPKTREAAIGGFSLASGLSVLLILYILDVRLGWEISTWAYYVLLAGGITQVIASLFCAIPLGELYVAASGALGLTKEPGLVLPPRAAKAVTALERLMGIIQMATAPLTAIILYSLTALLVRGMYRPFMVAPLPPEPAYVPLLMVMCISLVFSTLAAVISGFILVKRKYY